ncbi:hypothetical protein Q3H58_001515 [Pseudomonas psychrotolerans]|nr:hypothetical protein [Pseudomonas psychrotolerans]
MRRQEGEIRCQAAAGLGVQRQAAHGSAQLGQGFGVVGVGGGPGQARGVGGGIAQHAADALLQGQAIGPAAVQALDHGIEAITQALHLGRFG